MFEVAEAKTKPKSCHGISKLDEIYFSDLGIFKTFLKLEMQNEYVARRCDLVSLQNPKKEFRF